MSDTGASGMTAKGPSRSVLSSVPGFRHNAPKRNALVVLCYLLVLALLFELLLLFAL
jgi:K+ transporter